ncbi:LPXTG cell wall anchor domain-containing protein [Ligilactobacillus saerimneri]|uniref:LPXTG cell wall anchor domain-containing protein n=1 Tax=Ligilactobacillus saerimneri TaxID=228229 RepID=A0A7H9EMZ3_9LACO|nr:Rib/alpha-like domain-containing protein [Ligilactobacillus saerimneri]QLL78575.1 LPXTG cell wall anchor domain-containing protein [Ligilactobacillus saerimneri]
MYQTPDVTKGLATSEREENKVQQLAWQAPAQIDVSLNAVGQTRAYQALVTFADGSTAVIMVPVTVIDDRTDSQKYPAQAQQRVTVFVNDHLGVQSLMINADQLPSGTQIAWRTAPDTSRPGTYPLTIVVTYPDGSQLELPVTMIVKAKATSQTAATMPPATNGPTPTGVAHRAPTLPQTGEEAESVVMTTLGLALLTALGFGSVIWKRARNDENN